MVKTAKALLAAGHTDQEIMDWLLQMAPSYGAAKAALTKAKR